MDKIFYQLQNGAVVNLLQILTVYTIKDNDGVVTQRVIKFSDGSKVEYGPPPASVKQRTAQDDEWDWLQKFIMGRTLGQRRAPAPPPKKKTQRAG